MTKSVKDQLDAKIPRDIIRQRDGGGNRKLDYLEGWYVINRLNEVFGHDKWNVEITDVKSLETPKPSYLVGVKLTVVFENGLTKVSHAYGYGSDKGLNNPHELAIKEARTDAIKVAAKDLGMSFGLALYDKSQEFVEETNDKESEPTTKSSFKGRFSVSSSETEQKVSVQTTKVNAEETTENKIRDRLKATWDILVKKGKVQPTDAKTYLSKFNVASTKDLNKEQSLAFLNELNRLL